MLKYCDFYYQRKDTVMSGRQVAIQILMFLLLVFSCSSDPTSSGSGNNPVASITSPANNSEFDEGVLINIKDSATDEDSF